MNNLTFEEYSKLLDEAPTIRTARQILIEQATRFKKPKVPRKPFCGNCGSTFISTDQDWYDAMNNMVWD